MTLNEEITQQVTNWLEETGVQKQKLGQKIKLTRGAVSKRLNNRVKWTVDQIERLRDNNIINFKLTK